MITRADILSLRSTRGSRFISLFRFQSVKTEIYIKHKTDLHGENSELFML